MDDVQWIPSTSHEETTMIVFDLLNVLYAHIAMNYFQTLADLTPTTHRTVHGHALSLSILHHN